VAGRDLSSSAVVEDEEIEISAKPETDDVIKQRFLISSLFSFVDRRGSRYFRPV
jgi:hypothetical protein